MTILRPAILLLLLLALVTGGVYPLLTTALGEGLFPHQAAGSLITRDGQITGSALLGQNFTRPGYFQGRPSATAEMPYNPMASGGSNLAASNPALDTLIKQRVAALRAANPDASGAVPVELVTASGSGLDNGISPQAAEWQLARVAKARHLPREQLEALIAAHTDQPWIRWLGMPTVNVLTLNLALDALPAQP